MGKNTILNPRILRDLKEASMTSLFQVYQASVDTSQLVYSDGLEAKNRTES